MELRSLRVYGDMLSLSREDRDVQIANVEDSGKCRIAM